MSRRTQSRWLACKLHDYEVIERSRTMAERSKELASLEEQKATAMRAYGESIKKLKGELASLSDIISSGEEKRTVKCIEEYRDGQMVLVRTDTYEEVEGRRATDDERQANLFQRDEDREVREASEVIGRVIREADNAPGAANTEESESDNSLELSEAEDPDFNEVSKDEIET
jgi:hypothetical protein